MTLTILWIFKNMDFSKNSYFSEQHYVVFELLSNIRNTINFYQSKQFFITPYIYFNIFKLLIMEFFKKNIKHLLIKLDNQLVYKNNF